MENLPEGAGFEGNTFTWTPDYDQAGQYEVTFLVSDDEDPPLSDEETITITVVNTNRPPVLAEIGDREVDENNELSISLSAEDPDNDNLVNLDERAIGTHPEDPDSDGDTLLDGDEIDKYYTNPLLPDFDLDMDGDGLTNVEEIDIYGTNPSDPDSDLDGYTDKEEILAKSDPLDPTSIPKDRNYKWMYSFIIIVPVTVLSPIIVARRLNRRRLLR